MKYLRFLWLSAPVLWLIAGPVRALPVVNIDLDLGTPGVQDTITLRPGAPLAFAITVFDPTPLVTTGTAGIVFTGDALVFALDAGGVAGDFVASLPSPVDVADGITPVSGPGAALVPVGATALVDTGTIGYTEGLPFIALSPLPTTLTTLLVYSGTAGGPGTTGLTSNVGFGGIIPISPGGDSFFHATATIIVEQVPGPGAALLLATGVIGLGITRVRRRGGAGKTSTHFANRRRYRAVANSSRVPRGLR